MKQLRVRLRSVTDDLVQTLTATVQYEEDGFRVEGKLYRYRPAPLGRRRRRKRSAATPLIELMHAYVIDETNRGVRLMPDLLDFEALLSYMQTSCARCEERSVARFLFDARTQLAIGPLRRQFKELFKLHVHGQKVSFEIAHWSDWQKTYNTTLTLADEDPRVAVANAQRLIADCEARGIKLAVPRKSEE